MSKFCSNCGATLEDNVMFCSTCGTKQEAPVAPVAPAAPVYAAPVYEAPAAPVYEAPAAPVYEAPAAPAKKSKKGLAIGLVVGAVVLIAAAVLVYFLFFSNPYKAAFDARVDVETLGNFDAYETLVPEGYWDYLEDEYYVSRDKKVDREDVIDAAEESWEKYSEDVLSDQLGEDITFSYEIVKSVNMPETIVGYLAEAIEEDYGIEADRVQAAVKVIYHVSANSSIYANYSIYNQETLIKIDGKWYFADWENKYDDEGEKIYDEFIVNFEFGIDRDELYTAKDFESSYNPWG